MWSLVGGMTWGSLSTSLAIGSPCGANVYIYTHTHALVHMHSRAHTGAHTHTYALIYTQMEMYEVRYKWATTRKLASLPSVVTVCVISRSLLPLY